MSIGIFEIKDWEQDYLASKLSGHELSFFPHPLNLDNLPARRDFEAISVFVGSDLPKGVLESFPNLKLITTRSTGFDHIDLTAAAGRGLAVAYVPTYGENTVAEHVFGLILTLSHHLYEAYDRLRVRGVYDFEGLEGFDLKGKTLGVIGTGHIGQHVIRIAHGFDMKVIAYDTLPQAELAHKLDFSYQKTLTDLLALADIVTIHVPYFKATHHLINQDNIYQMKRGAYLINTARGAIIATDALIRALKDGHLAGAGLDVLEEEGIMKDELGHLLLNSAETDLKIALENHVLIDMPNVIITPHSAFNTREAKMRILDATIDNLNSFASFGKPTHPVSFPVS